MHNTKENLERSDQHAGPSGLTSALDEFKGAGVTVVTHERGVDLLQMLRRLAGLSTADSVEVARCIASLVLRKVITFEEAVTLKQELS